MSHTVQRLLTNSFQVQHRQWLDNKNQGSALTFDSIGYKIDDATMLKWTERGGGEDSRGKEEAREYMRQAGEASNPIKDITSRCNMLPGHRKLMSQDMLRDSYSEVYARVAPPKDFPKDTQGRHSFMQQMFDNVVVVGDKAWTRTFYRYIDSSTDPEIVEVEANVFHKVQS